MNKKLDNPLLVIFIFFMITLILMVFLIKYFGSTELGNLVERDGYCKSAYEDDDWSYSENRKYCFNTNLTRKLEQRYFTEEEFRTVCPKNKFFSKQFYSDCFHIGDSR